jgi:hypothetical protein
MSKRGRDPMRTTNAERHPALHKISKRYGRSRGPLVMGINGVMVTQKVFSAQKRNKHIDE